MSPFHLPPIPIGMVCDACMAILDMGGLKTGGRFNREQLTNVESQKAKWPTREQPLANARFLSRLVLVLPV